MVSYTHGAEGSMKRHLYIPSFIVMCACWSWVVFMVLS